LDFLACFHDLPLDQPIVDSSVLLYFLQNGVFFVDPVKVPVLDVAESPLPVAVHALVRLYLSLFNINYLSYVKNVLYSGLHIPNELL
jgi:hypothetical protein